MFLCRKSTSGAYFFYILFASPLLISPLFSPRATLFRLFLHTLFFSVDSPLNLREKRWNVGRYALCEGVQPENKLCPSYKSPTTYSVSPFSTHFSPGRTRNRQLLQNKPPHLTSISPRATEITGWNIARNAFIFALLHMISSSSHRYFRRFLQDKRSKKRILRRISSHNKNKRKDD